MILGADIFAKIALSGVIKSEDGAFMLQETIFGWIISGSIENDSEMDETLDMRLKIFDDRPHQFKRTLDRSIAKRTNWLLNIKYNFVGLIFFFVLVYCIGTSYAQILQVDNFTGASNFNNISNDEIMECTHSEHKQFNLEGAGPVYHSLEFLQTMVRKMQHETAIHRYLHVHHLLILYSCITWILFCLLSVWVQRRNNKQQPNIHT